MTRDPRQIDPGDVPEISLHAAREDENTEFMKMDGIPVKTLASDLKIPVVDLIKQLQFFDFDINQEDDLVTNEQQLFLLRQTAKPGAGSKNPSSVSIADLQNAPNLTALNDLLTRAMADRTIQALIKDEDLQTVVDTIITRSAEEQQPLMATAMLGRLAAVTRQTRADSVYERADQVLTEEPPSFVTLADGDGKQKHYAAQVLSHMSASWAPSYRYREALAIDTADNARRELLAANLMHEGAIADWLVAITQHAVELNSITNLETRLKRIRRLFNVMRDVVDSWRNDVGAEAGPRLADCMKAFLTGKLVDLDQATLVETLDYLLAILVRVIELRFSNALNASTYDLLDQGKRTLGPSLWGRFVSKSAILPELRIALLETALVLARQNRTDKQIMNALSAVYSSRSQLAISVKRHFEDAHDLDPDIAEWWRSAGEASGTRRHMEHKVGNTEDQQIGALLIEVESNREAMEKLGCSVVGYLEISEPVLASTVKKAADGYHGIAQTTRRLARMRKLTKTDLKGARLDYNPLEHEMLGGHRSGVRRVKVVRDGIQKEFGGKIKTLVKPWVEPESE